MDGKCYNLTDLSTLLVCVAIFSRQRKEMTVKKIGLFGGTFDPIHYGHINLAIELKEKKQLDQVWFIPTNMNPFKEMAPPIPLHHRLTMIQHAIEKIPDFYLKDQEKEQATPSYAIHTLQAIIGQEAKDTLNRFYFLMGEDTVPGFCDWYLPEAIIQLVPLLIGSRSGIWQHELFTYSITIREAIETGLTSTRLIDISSSEIRDRICHHLYCGHLLPTAVIDYIQKNQLYRSKS
jgi:nicotinate-nucleotide adenylyltransferase